MKAIKKSVLQFIPKKLIGLRKEKEKIDCLEINLTDIDEYLYFRSIRHYLLIKFKKN